MQRCSICVISFVFSDLQMCEWKRKWLCFSVTNVKFSRKLMVKILCYFWNFYHGNKLDFGGFFPINSECLLIPSESCEKSLNWLSGSCIPKLICSAIVFILRACFFAVLSLHATPEFLPYNGQKEHNSKRTGGGVRVRVGFFKMLNSYILLLWLK